MQERMVRPEAKPALKWAGGKRWLLPRLEPLWAGHEHRRLVEPFVGGMAVALGLRPQRALLNDFNEHLVNFYRHLQRGLEVDVEFVHDEAAYYRLRNRFNDLVRDAGADSSEAAQLFYYLNRTGFNGLCRFNARDEFNVPFGRYARIRYATSRDFEAYRAALAGWTFSSGDFEAVSLEPGDFVYADPPYDDVFTGYSKREFDWMDQQRLAHWLAGHDGPVVASNRATDRIVELYRELGFTVETVDAPRRISCNGDRTPAPEMVATRGLKSTR